MCFPSSPGSFTPPPGSFGNPELGGGPQDPHRRAWSILAQQVAQEALLQTVSFLFG